MKPVTYLDYNATTPIRPEVIEAITAAMAVGGNPSSVHSIGRNARAKVEEARAQVAALVAARPRDVVFTSGGTEANNTVIRGCGAKRLILSPVEHDCGLAAAKASGLPTSFLRVTQDGVVESDSLRETLEQSAEPALVSVMLANNEMGTIQPIAALAAIAKEYGALFHTDAVQAAGKISIDREALKVDYLTLSAHKLGGPQGVGAVILAPTAPLKALITGGGQELSRRSGTENVAGIVGFGVSAMEAMVGLADMDRIRSMRDRLEREILSTANDIMIAGGGAERLANTSCIIMPDVKGETQVMHFDLNGVCISSGSACSSGKVKVSHVLTAMGYSDTEAESSIRVSLGYDTTDKDIDRFLDAWRTLYARTRGR